MTSDQRHRELKKEYIKYVLANISKIQGKDKCYNLFQNTKVREYKMYNPKVTSKFVKYKSLKLRKTALLTKIRFLIILRAFSGYGQCVFLDLLLLEKSLSREIFLLDVEQGDEVRIPKEIQQDDLSISFRFYDPILALI